jgi:hypothetical protein
MISLAPSSAPGASRRTSSAGKTRTPCTRRITSTSFRDEFYQAITNSGTTTMAQWATDFVQGNLQNLGP